MSHQDLPGAYFAGQSACAFLLCKANVLYPERNVGLESLNGAIHDVQLATDECIVANCTLATRQSYVVRGETFG